MGRPASGNPDGSVGNDSAGIGGFGPVSCCMLTALLVVPTFNAPPHGSGSLLLSLAGQVLEGGDMPRGLVETEWSAPIDEG